MSHHRRKIDNCWLLDEELDKLLDGDLYVYEGMHIFVGSLGAYGAADWLRANDPRRTAEGDPTVAVIIPRGATYFERRGIILFKEGVLTLEGQRLIREQE